MLKILVIAGSTRPNRKSEEVAKWFKETAQDKEVQFEFVDLAELNLPFFDEPMPPMMGQYQNDHTKQWAAKLDAADGFVFVVPEYNHGYPAVLKNAIDFAYAEWRHKPAGFVSYGVMGGVRAVEQLKQVVAQLDMMPLSVQVSANVMQQWSEGTFTPTNHDRSQAKKLLGELKWWGNALKVARKER